METFHALETASPAKALVVVTFGHQDPYHSERRKSEFHLMGEKTLTESVPRILVGDLGRSDRKHF